jgi:hypothetical protein
MIAWSSLGEHRIPSPSEHVLRPIGSGERLASLIRRGLGPLAVVGPSGAGKTTELDQATGLLASDFTVMNIPVATICPLDDLSAEHVVFGLAQAIVDIQVTSDETFRPPQSLVKDIRASDPRFPRGNGNNVALPELTRLCVGEVIAHTKKTRLVVFLEGLEEATAERALLALRGLWSVTDALDLAVVVPASLAHGPVSHEVLDRMRVFPIPAIPIREDAGPAALEGREFLRELVRRRLHLDAIPDDVLPVVDAAGATSGGLPRTFLRLVADAASYGFGTPTLAGLAEAVDDRVDAYRRVLITGDLQALAAADGTTGLEMPLDKRVRLLEQGLLLEYTKGSDVVVHPHPLLTRLLAG